MIYRPFRFFGVIGAGIFSVRLAICLLFLWHVFNGDRSGHIQSLILAPLLMGMGFQTILIAFVANLLAANRKLIEEVRFKTMEHIQGGKAERRNEFWSISRQGRTEK